MINYEWVLIVFTLYNTYLHKPILFMWKYYTLTSLQEIKLILYCLIFPQNRW